MSRFQSLFAGQLLTLAASTPSQTLLEKAVGLVEDAFGESPESLDAETFRSALSRSRERFAGQDFSVLALSCLAVQGFELEGLMLDTVRFRAVSPGLEKIEAAAPVFYCHRDTWYGNPNCQVNAWMPLHDVGPNNSFRFYTDYFHRPIKNDSHLFLAADFENQGGFGRVSAQGSDSHYPRALEIPGAPVREVEMAAGEMLFFSAAHLHQTSVNLTDRPRFSLDFRFFRRGHLENGVGAPDPDNHSRGLSLSSFRPAEVLHRAEV